MTQHKVVIDFVHGLMRVGTSATVPFLSREQVAEVMQRERQPAHYQRSAHDERGDASVGPDGGEPAAATAAAPPAAVRDDVLHPRPYLRVHDAALRRLLPRLYMAAGFFNHGRAGPAGRAAEPAPSASPPAARPPASRPPPRVVFQQ